MKKTVEYLLNFLRFLWKTIASQYFIAAIIVNFWSLLVFFVPNQQIKSFSFPGWFLITILIVTFCLSAYEEWRKQKEKNEMLLEINRELELRIKKQPKKKKVDYKITYNIQPIKKISIKSLEEEVKKLQKELSNPKRDLWLGPSVRLFGFPVSRTEKIENLKEEIKHAKEFNKKYSNVYQVIFYVKNTGNMADENINIVIIPDKQTKVLSESENDEIYYTLYLEENNNIVKLPATNRESIQPTREIVTEKEDYFEVEISLIRPDDKWDIIGKPIFIRKKEFKYKFEIISKELSERIIKIVK